MNLPAGLIRGATRGPALVRDVAVRADHALSCGPRTTLNHARERRRARLGETAASDRVYATLWSDAASELGASVRELPGGLLEIRLGLDRTRVWRQWVELDDAVTIRAALNRTLVDRALTAAAVPVPDNLTVSIGDLAPAERFLEQHGSVAVKPAAGTGGGRGTTVGVCTVPELRRAALLASRHDAEVVVERSAAGDVYRFLFLDGRLLDVVRRSPPHVTGDGRSPIRRLIQLENARRLEARGDAGLPLITANLDMLLTLARSGLTLSSVPVAGARLAVKTVTNQSGPADNHTIHQPAADALVEEARRAAEAVGVRLAGVDLIAPDLDRPLGESGGVVIEVNAGPGLHHHYHVADPATATRVCVPVLAQLLATGPTGDEGQPLASTAPPVHPRTLGSKPEDSP